MKFKRVMRYESRRRLLRICRFMRRVGTVGDGQGYSEKFSLAVEPKVFAFYREQFGRSGDVFLTLLGLRIHYQRSYGGVHV